MKNSKGNGRAGGSHKRYIGRHLVLLNQGPLWRWAVSECSWQMVQMEAAKAEWRRLQVEDTVAVAKGMTRRTRASWIPKP